MDLTLKIKGKEKTFESKKITFRRFREATELLIKFNNDEFLSDGYPDEEMNRAVSLIADYFGVTPDEFEEGFEVADSTDFFLLFSRVLQNIQLNDGKRKVETDEEGK